MKFQQRAHLWPLAGRATMASGTSGSAFTEPHDLGRDVDDLLESGGVVRCRQLEELRASDRRKL